MTEQKLNPLEAASGLKLAVIVTIMLWCLREGCSTVDRSFEGLAYSGGR